MSLRLRLGHCQLLIGAEQAYFYPAVLGAGKSISPFVRRIFLPQANLLNPEDGNVVPSNQISRYVFGPPPAQLVVVGYRAGLVGEALDGNEVTLGVGMRAHELVQLFFSVGGQHILAKTKLNRCLSLKLVIIQIPQSSADRFAQ